MNEFEAAGFDKEVCERLREISIYTGIPPCSLIGAFRSFKPAQSLIEVAKKGKRK